MTADLVAASPSVRLGAAVEGNGAGDSAQFLCLLAEPTKEERRAATSSIAPTTASMATSPA